MLACLPRARAGIVLLAAVLAALALALVGTAGPGAVATADAQVGSAWQSTTPITEAVTSPSTVKFGHRVYRLGGYSFDMSTFTLNISKKVEWADVANDGSVGAWHSTTPFNISRLGQTAVRHGNYIYVIGGGDGENFSDDVEYARVGNDGNITAEGWIEGAYRTHEKRAAATSNVEVIDGVPYLYVVGGAGMDAAGNYIHFDSTEYARINADGSLGPWTLSPSEFNRPRSSQVTAIVGGCLYMIGGWGDLIHDIYDDVQYSCLNSDGSLGPWSTSPNKMSTVRYWPGAVVDDNPDGSATLTVLGGNRGDGTYLNQVEKTTLNPGGTPGNTPWVGAPQESWLPAGTWGQSAQLMRGNVYVFGGVLRDQTYLDDVIYAPIGSLFP